MKRLLWLLTITCTAACGFSQETFVKLYPEGESSGLYPILQTSDGNLLLGGTESSDTANTGFYMKTDLMGNILWKHYINSMASPGFFREDADSNYWFEYSHKSGDMYYVNLMKVSSEGDSITTIGYEYPMMPCIYSSVWLPDGSCSTIWLVNSWPAMPYKFWLYTKTDATGAITYTDTLSQYDPLDVSLYDIFYTSGNVFVLRAEIGETDSFDILKLDDLGTVIDSVTIDSIVWPQILATPDGFVITGYFDDSSDTTFYGVDRMKIEKYDTEFHLAWSALDTIYYKISYTELTGSYDGGIVTLSEPGYPVAGSGDIHSKKYSADGDLQWHSVIHNENRLRTVQFTELNDRRFAITGEYSPAAPAFSFPSLGMLIITDTLCQLNDSRISGRVFYDVNGNELSDSMDIGIPDQIIVTDPGPFYSNTDAAGNYFIDVYGDSSTFHITTEPPSYFYQTFPDSPFYQVVALDTCYSYDSVDFAEEIDVEIQDMVVDQHLFNLPIGHSAQFDITISNEGSMPVYGAEIKYKIADLLVLDSVSLPYDSYVDNTITWTLDSLALFSNRQIHVYVYIPADSALIGEYLLGIASADPSISDITPSDNIDSTQYYVDGAWDPNHKSVEPAGTTENGFIDPLTDALTYTIDFQNTGNYPAEFVTLVDTIDEHLNLSSIEMISASHDYTMEFVFPNIVKWHFDHINLPDSGTNWLASQGYVKFKIELQPGLPEMTTIENTAGIYFDFNPAVLTNTVINTLDLTNAVENIPALSNTLVYPNPAASAISFTGISGDASVRIFDMSGKLMLIKHIAGVEDVMDISTLASGIYQIAIINGNNEYTSVRLVKL